MPTAKSITVRVPGALLDAIERIAGETGQRVGTIASHLLADGVARHCGLEATPHEWRINGIGKWPRKEENAN